MADTQVVIVGAGPVGMAAALLLARFGVHTVILEAQPPQAPVGSKSLCTQGDVLDILERIGIGERLAAEGVTWRLGRIYYRERELLRITFPGTGYAHFPPFVNIGQDRVQHWLERGVTDEPRTEVRYRHRVTAIVNRPDRVEVTFDRGGRCGTIGGSYAICADGARGPGRRFLGIDFPGRSFADRFLICDIRADLPFAAERRFFFDPPWNPDRQVLIHPQVDSVWRIDWQVPPSFDLEEAQVSGALDELIRRIVGDREYEIVWMSVYRFHQRIAGRFAAGGTFLAGDAAHLYAPFGARGLNSGIQDAENLAWKLAFVLSGWAPHELLGTYETERRAAALENLAVTGATMDFLVPGDEDSWRRRRSILERAVTDPAARRLVDSGRLAEPFWYLDSPLTTPASPQALAAFPREAGVKRPALAGTLCPDGPCAVEGRPEVFRLRQLFGKGLVVLHRRPHGISPDASADRPAIHHLDAIDTTGALRDALGIEPDHAAVIRPDGHIAAIVPAREGALRDAARRAIGGNL